MPLLPKDIDCFLADTGMDEKHFGVVIAKDETLVQRIRESGKVPAFLMLRMAAWMDGYCQSMIDRERQL